jgi:hypothetical protein
MQQPLSDAAEEQPGDRRVRERTSGTLDRMLVATFRRGEIVLGRPGPARVQHRPLRGPDLPAFIPAVIVPSLLPSGLLIPFDQLSWPLQALARLVLLMYAADVLVPVFRNGQPVAERLVYLVLLAGYAAALVTVASLTLRERE